MDVMSENSMVWAGTPVYTTPPANKGEGKAFQLNGSNNHLTATTNEYADTELFTVCGWVKLDTTTGGQMIVHARDSTGGWSLSQDAGILYLTNASVYLATSYGTELSAGVWAHIAIVFNGASSVLYVNGVQRAATFTADWIAAAADFLELGVYSTTGTQYLDGELFDWRLYERALTESQLLGLINGPSFGSEVATEIDNLPSILVEDLGSTSLPVDFLFDNGSGFHKKVIATDDIALTFTATVPGYYTAILEMDGTGGHLISYTTTVIGKAPIISTVASSKTLIPLFYDGSTWFHVSQQENATARTTQLNSLTSIINTEGKYEGKQVFNTDTNIPVYALGSAASALWADATGTTAHTPV